MRGNDGDSYPDGRNSVGATLHWGTSVDNDAYWTTTGKHNVRRTDYSEAFHTYGLEWSQNYIFMYLDSRLLQVFNTGFGGETMWMRGNFGSMTSTNGSILVDPWSQTGRYNTPFDQKFYLILNVAVGATNGYFQ